MNTEKRDIKPFYTPSQAARAVGVTRKTIYNWMDAGKVKASRRDVDGRPLFTERDVERMRAMLAG